MQFAQIFAFSRHTSGKERHRQRHSPLKTRDFPTLAIGCETLSLTDGGSKGNISSQSELPDTSPHGCQVSRLASDRNNARVAGV